MGVATVPRSEWTSDYLLQKYPRVIAHMICESLGYFTPRSAASALAAYGQKRAYFCEWYSHCASFMQVPAREGVMEVNASVVQHAFRNRARHSGYMSSYAEALRLVRRAAQKEGEPVLASWF